VILEALTSLDRTWDDLHHRSYFLSELRRIEEGEFVFTMIGDRSCPINPLATQAAYVKGNMDNIIQMIPKVIENFFVKVDYSLEEIQIYTELFK
jgi:hypothetical protein